MRKLLSAFLGLAFLAGLWTYAQPQAVLPPSDTINCAYNAALPTLTTGQMGRVQCDSTGRMLTTTGTTTGGGTGYHLLSTASTNSTSVKASAGQVSNLTILNTTATLYYFKFYDKATAPTCASDTVLQNYPVPASTTGAGFTIPLNNLQFTAGIGFCLTGALSDTDNTNAATGIAINLVYR